MAPWRPRRVPLAWLLATLALVLSLALAGPAHADLDTIRSRGVLRVVVSDSAPPELYSVASDGPPGFHREILEGFARLHGVRVESRRVSPEQRVPLLLDGKADLIAAFVDTPERRQQIAFSAEVMPVQHVAVSCRPQAPIASLEALRQARVGLRPGTSWAAAAAEAGVPVARSVSFETLPDLLDALCAGRVGATVMDAPGLVLELRRRPGLLAGIAVGRKLSGAWGLRKADTQLRQKADEYIAGLRHSPMWSRLLVRYYGTDAVTALRLSDAP